MGCSDAYATAPKPNKVLTPKEIAAPMIVKDFREYFESNLKYGITTFQDEEILKELESKSES
jgi:hypothetical protein